MAIQKTLLALFVASALFGTLSTYASENEAEIEARIQKVGSINMQSATTEVESTAVADSGSIDGAALYQASCFACHGTGAAGAPKLGDAAAWAPRLAKGEEALISSAINGVGAMPAKGGNGSLSDDEIKAIVEHMISGSQ